MTNAGWSQAGTGHGSSGSGSGSSAPIAVVGLSCRLPGDATNPSRLWELLRDGKSAWSPIPKDKFNVDAFFHPNPDRNGTINVRGGHFLKEDIGRFDCSFFNISPNEAKAIDPQQRLQLESAYEALENAGIPMENVAGSNTSVYVGVFNRDYSDMLARDPETAPVYQSTGNGQAILSNRISYFFDLKGPSMTLDTACSASLAALHLACQSLRTGESKMAIVGGTNMMLSPDIMISMSLVHFLSEEGRCYTYDHRASGYARGEGVATVVLKPLEDALRDGDPIRAVIRETAVNQDGRTSGITLPSRTAQEALIRKAYSNAGLDPADTHYFEAHGTGTAAGDPLEAGAIASVLGSVRPPNDPIFVGSIKTNVGHLEGASGLAGLIKAILILENGMIPPNLNFEKPNDAIPLEEWNIKIPVELKPWPKPGLRRASVNSFGYGGTNAHAILDDAYHFLQQYRSPSANGVHTNGAGKGASNGITNGTANGFTKAITNGATNAISNRTANGIANGATNGFTNGTANGFTNGAANGTTNGNANGFTNGNGTANGFANGTSNGFTNGNANGFTNGHANGFTNGNANGFTNGNGTSNGFTNGNGTSNGFANGANGTANGFTNGNANGFTNGFTNGSGTANGFTNGNANGFTNGHANGFTNGHANGFTNGFANGNGTANGFTNGNTNGNTNGFTNGTTNGFANGTANGFTNGSANGTPNSFTSGFTNGTANGFTNGSANGTPNSFTNGFTNGTTNGFTNGTTNGTPNSFTNGFTNGTTNGSINGTPNGANSGTSRDMPIGTSYEISNGTSHGATNGITNGMTNGATNGTIYGVMNGTTNGTTNGTNFLNGYNGTANGLSILNRSSAVQSPSKPQSRLFLLSANDSTSGKEYAKLLGSYIRDSKASNPDQQMKDLAYTLAERRSKLPFRLAVRASTPEELVAVLDGADGLKFIRSAKPPRLGFVFTGQGAQWFAMGRELLPVYSVFRGSLERADTVLRNLGATWSLLQELLCSEQTTRIDEPLMSQPLCTAIQLALVDMLSSWNIMPSAVVGHSSGEIAASYAAGVLDFESAMKVAYYRGIVSSTVPERYGGHGAMLAVGLGREDAEARIATYPPETGRVGIACVNSPASVTLSGDTQAVEALCAHIKSEGVFARLLKVGVAYHSHQMLAVAEQYFQMLDGLKPEPAKPGVQFFSSVTGQHMPDTTALDAQYWVRNMVSPVLFSDAAAAMSAGMVQGKTKERRRGGSSGVDLLVEVGPHSALAGPLKQILVEQRRQQKQDSSSAVSILPYSSALVRGKDAVETALDLVGLLATNAYDAKLDAVNFPEGRSAVKVVCDLPPYAWNHATIHWSESRLSTSYRFRKFPRHDLLGAPVSDFNPTEPRWRNFIRLSENPWVRDHQVTRSILYPAAGMMVMAIEAMRQMLVIGDVQTPVDGYELRDVNIGKALVVPESAEGVETILALRPLTASARSSSDLWHEFRIFSISKVEGWVEHSRGRISYRFRQAPTPVDGGREAECAAAEVNQAYRAARSACVHPIKPDSMYESLDAIGLSYGETFRNITQIAGGPGQSFSKIKIANTRDTMPYRFEHPYLVHPATLDCALQTMFPALAPPGKVIETPMVPTFVRSMFISSEITSDPGYEYEAWSDARYEGFKSTLSNVTVVDGRDGSGVRPVMEIRGMECANLVDQASPLGQDNQSRPSKLCFTMDWDTDVDLMTPTDLARLSPVRPTSEQEHKQIITLDEVAYYYMDAALKQLSPSATLALNDYRRLFYNWMVAQVDGVRKGKATNFSPHWLTATETDKISAMEWIRNACIEGKVVCRLGENLASMLRQEVEPLDLMLEDNMLYDMYRYSMGLDRCYEHMTAFVDKMAHKNPTMRVLEIGAGTGGATLPILQTLGGADGKYPRFSSYDFTDISSGFFEKARETLKEWGSLIQFKKLDIEQPPAEQGFAEGSYDLIVAANVLHATKHIRVTMDHVRRLLKPGGKLVLMELGERTMRMTFTLGNLPGWWLGADEGRTEGPSLSVDEWATVLRSTGFSSPQMASPDYLDVGDRIYTAITATAEDLTSHSLPQILVVSPQNSSDSALAAVDDVMLNIGKLAGDTTVSRVSLPELNMANVDGALIVFLIELESPQLANLSSLEFDAIRNAMGTAKGVFWIARGGTVEGSMPEANLITGLSRTVRSEKHALKFITLDLDAARVSASGMYSTSTDVDVITRVFGEAFRNINENQGVDFEYSERNGQVMIPRIFDDRSTNEFIARDTGAAHIEKAPFVQPNRAFKIEIGVPGLLDSLRFVDDPVYTEKRPLGPDEVDIDIRATGVNFKDVMVSMGQIVEDFLGHEVAGVITRVGSNVMSLRVGDRVCAWTLGGYGTQIRNQACLTSRIPDTMCFEQAASLPIVYCTAYHALFDIGRLQPGERVLIHAAAGGVGQAAIQLCQYAGAEVFVTVGTESKRELVMEQYGIPADHIFSSRDTTFAPGIMRMTGGHGMDVILNSLAGEPLLASWDCIARFGRFVEIGKRDITINSKLTMANFERNVTFASLDLTVINRHNKAMGGRILSSVMELVHSGSVREVFPLTVFKTSETEKAFRLMQAGKHVGKLIVASDPACEVPVLTTAENAHPLKLSGYASYLLVGGLGGLGRGLSGWLAEHGARHIIFLSRSGTDKPAARECVDELTRAGVHTAVYKCDVGDAVSLGSALEACRREFPPIRGIIHAGMVLRDGIFDNMSHEEWKQALHPKINGTRNLCNVFSGSSLDFFTVLSSSAGVVGSYGQGNYGAASAFQDAMSYNSASLASESGLPLTTVDLGMVLGFGYVAENAHVEANLKKWGFLGIEPDQFFSIIKSSILEPRRPRPRCQLMTGLGTRGMVDDGLSGPDPGEEDDVPFWFYDVKFSHLLQLDKKLAGAADGDSDVNLPTALRAAQTLGDAQQIICDALLDKMSKILVMALEDLNGQMPMAAYGVDSLVAVELRNWIFRETKVDVPMFDMLGDNSLMGLCEGIAKKSSLVSEKLRAE